MIADGMQFAGGVVMFAGGIGGVVQAWRALTRYRAMRSLTAGMAPGATGLVRVRGLARTGRPLRSPLTGTSCCYYRVVVEEDKGSAFSFGSSTGREGPNWQQIWTEESGDSFSIDGGLGAALVQPAGLQVDAKPVLEREIYSGPRQSGDQQLLAYLRCKSPDPFRNFLWEKATSALRTPDAAARPDVREKLRRGRERLGRKLERDVERRNYRFREYCILTEEEYELVATLRPDGARGRVLTCDSANGLFLISTGSSREIERRQRRLAWSFAGWGAGIALFGLTVLIFA